MKSVKLGEVRDDDSLEDESTAGHESDFESEDEDEESWESVGGEDGVQGMRETAERYTHGTLYVCVYVPLHPRWYWIWVFAGRHASQFSFPPRSVQECSSSVRGVVYVCVCARACACGLAILGICVRHAIERKDRVPRSEVDKGGIRASGEQ